LESGVRKELISKTEIKDSYHQENKLKFSQTIGIPAMSGQLMKDLGFLGNSTTY